MKVTHVYVGDKFIHIIIPMSCFRCTSYVMFSVKRRSKKGEVMSMIMSITNE